MDIEKAEHINLAVVVVVFLLAITFFADQIFRNLAVSLSLGIIATSLVLIFCLFREIVGISFLLFVITLSIVTIIVGSAVIGLFISSLLLGLFILFTILTR